MMHSSAFTEDSSAFEVLNNDSSAYEVLSKDSSAPEVLINNTSISVVLGNHSSSVLNNDSSDSEVLSNNSSFSMVLSKDSSASEVLNNDTYIVLNNNSSTLKVLINDSFASMLLNNDSSVVLNNHSSASDVLSNDSSTPKVLNNESSTSKVLANDDMLGEILQRLHCPTCLVNASLPNKHWYHNASQEATISAFRSRQSPQLLGIYISGDALSQPEFVSFPDASISELGVALRRGKFGFDDLGTFLFSIWDCRNDRVLYGFAESMNLALVPSMRTPLRGHTVVLPPQPSTTWPNCPHAMLLPDDTGDESSCYRVDIGNNDRMVYARVFNLRDGSWTINCVAVADVDRSPQEILKMTVLMCGKIYMLTAAGYILMLDLATASFSTINLPEGAEFLYSGNLAPCRGDDSILYLFHVKQDKLTVWFQRMNDCAGKWVVMDTIPLWETCGHLIEQGWEPAEGESTIVSVVGVGDNAEFVFLEFEETGVIVYLHLNTRSVKVVYQRHPDNDFSMRVFPIMMVFPPFFPRLVAHERQGLHQE